MDSTEDEQHGSCKYDLEPSPISKLPNDCLACIFSLLPIVDRIRMQKNVSKIEAKPIKNKKKVQSNLGELNLRDMFMAHRDHCDKNIFFLFRNNQYLRGINVLVPALRVECWQDLNPLDVKNRQSSYGDRLDYIKIHCTYNLGDLKLKPFEHFQNLRKLRDQRIDVHLFETCLKHCSKLNSVQLQDLAATDTEVLKITQLSELQELHLTELSEVTDAIFLNSVPSLTPQSRRLEFSNSVHWDRADTSLGGRITIYSMRVHVAYIHNV
ncbi:hypothetical protein TSAR_002498 [Trichomalopsis sarcophagae]|uniref:F-box domain-containing protein n=1 Tax=Trichomalopsis sarcophagae TaxID=543379 RepID=A0A232EMX6_9HYME|nr:hypothetical protein TSAR_002498 [Trichomalopsis sarcophagae]